MTTMMAVVIESGIAPGGVTLYSILALAGHSAELGTRSCEAGAPGCSHAKVNKYIRLWDKESYSILYTQVRHSPCPLWKIWIVSSELKAYMNLQGNGREEGENKG